MLDPSKLTDEQLAKLTETMMKQKEKKQKKIARRDWLWVLGVLVFAFGLGWLVSGFVGCDAFQKKIYTKEDGSTSFARLFELCYKAEKESKAAGGGNTLHCKDLMDTLTPKGRFENFKVCAIWASTRKPLLKQYSDFNCFKIFYPEYGNRKRKNKAKDD